MSPGFLSASSSEDTEMRSPVVRRRVTRSMARQVQMGRVEVWRHSAPSLLSDNSADEAEGSSSLDGEASSDNSRSSEMSIGGNSPSPSPTPMDDSEDFEDNTSSRSSTRDSDYSDFYGSEKVSNHKVFQMNRHDGLISITIRTMKLMRRNQQLQQRLTQLQAETRAFVRSVMNNPENQALRLTTESMMLDKRQDKEKNEDNEKNEDSENNNEKTATNEMATNGMTDNEEDQSLSAGSSDSGEK